MIGEVTGAGMADERTQSAEPVSRSVDLDRRRFIRLVALASVSILPGSALAGILAPASERSLSFYSLHTGESLKTVYWTRDGYVASALHEINHILRDFRANEVKPIDLRLLDLLVAVRTRLGTNEPFHVISGYRSPLTNAMLHAHSEGVAVHSLHVEGKAIDVRVPGRELAGLRRAALDLHEGGVGYYPRSDFVHIDVGRFRFW
jgi:uncharacterized protein YcbK (DUF882 family)